MAEFSDYFKKEMRYLREVGQEFGKAFPEVAGRLDIDAQEDADPTVERLFEGFAFLTAKIQQKLDEGFPELASTLIEEIEPSLTRPVPSLVLLEFIPRPGMLPASKMLTAGTKFKAIAQQNNEPYWFRLTHAVQVHPIELSKLDLHCTPNRNAITFEFSKKSPLAKFPFPQDLVIRLTKDESIAWSLLYCIIAKSGTISVDCDEQSVDASAVRVKALGCSRAESLLPDETHSMPGARNIREFFSFEEKCLGFTMQALPKVPEAWQKVRIHINISSSSPLSAIPQVDTSYFSLNCFPAINLFEEDAEPILLERGFLEYGIRPHGRSSHEIFSITEVCAGNSKGTGSETMLPFGRVVYGKDSLSRFHVTYANDFRGQRAASIGVPTPALIAKGFEVLSLQALCFQGQGARDFIQVGAIKDAPAGFPDSIQLRNISKPSLPISAISSADAHQSLLELMQDNFAGLANREALISYLDLLATGIRSHSVRLLQSIETVQVHTERELQHGALVPVLAYEILAKDSRLTPQSYAELGRYRILAELIFRLFVDYAPLNCLVTLKFQIAPLGEVFLLNNFIAQ